MTPGTDYVRRSPPAEPAWAGTAFRYLVRENVGRVTGVLFGCIVSGLDFRLTRSWAIGDTTSNSRSDAIRQTQGLKLAFAATLVAFVVPLTGCPPARPYTPPAGSSPLYCVYPITAAPEGADYAVGAKICNHCKNPTSDSGCKLGNRKFKIKGAKGTFEYTFGAAEDTNCGTCPEGGLAVEAN